MSTEYDAMEQRMYAAGTNPNARPYYTNCEECGDVVRRCEVDAEGVCTLCLDGGGVA